MLELHPSQWNFAALHMQGRQRDICATLVARPGTYWPARLAFQALILATPALPFSRLGLQYAGSVAFEVKKIL